MFDIFFGWRKASKCKKLIKQLRCRLKQLKNKRGTIVRQLREDVAELIKLGYEDKALDRAEQLFKDESIMTLYELLDNFCEFISTNFSYIRRHKDCPNDINEAVSSLIFASSRCGDLPELRVIRKLFAERYGQSFPITASELLPGNLVNLQIKEKLSITLVPDDEKYHLVDEIAKDYCLRPEILAIEFASEEQQIQSNCGHQIEKNSLMEASNASNIQDIQADSSLTSKNETTRQNHSYRNSDAVSTSISSSIVHQSSPDLLESPSRNKPEIIGNCSLLDAKCTFTVASGDSSEGVSWNPEEKVVYLDDIEELQSSIRTDRGFQDQRLFKFNFQNNKTEILDNDGNEGNSYMVEGDESWSGKSSSRSSRTSGKNSRRRRRSMSRETNLSIKDILCEIYYEKSRKCTSNHNLRKHYQKKNNTMEGKYNLMTTHSPKRQKQEDINNCSLENPCYGCISDGQKEQEIESSKRNIGRRRSCDNYATVHKISTYLNEKSHKPEGKDKGFVASDSLTGKKPGPCYVTVKTMPPERSKGNRTDGNYQRWNSFPFPNPEYVHPKLPDYDDIATKFMALKRERLQNKH